MPKTEAAITAIFPQVVKWRRQIHMRPEIANEEIETSRLVAQVLTDLGIPVTYYPDSTAVVGLIEGRLPGPTLALRADMDALPVQEETGLAFASRIEGKMHACGHDLHTSNLLGVASILADKKDQIKGRVKLIFQPAEEGGRSGGLELTRAGVMHDVDQIYALHVQPELPTGTISVTPGYCTSNSDRATVRILGQGGHGAHPETTVDAVVVAAKVVDALQTVVSRNVAAQEAAVVTVGLLRAGTVNNIIAEKAEMQLSLRSLTGETQELLRTRIEKVLQGVCAAYGAGYEFDYSYGYPAVFNHEIATGRLLQVAETVLGKENLVINPKASMVGEDFAYYAQEAPGVLFWLGARPPAHEPTYPLHNPKVTFNEDCLKIGMRLMVDLILGQA